MDDGKRRKHKHCCDEYLESTKGSYSLNANSGIYQPKSTPPEQHSERITPGASRETPLFTETDWGPVIANLLVTGILSLLTLLVVAKYTWVTTGIYETSQAAAIGTIQAAWASQSSAETAAAGLQLTQEQFRNEQRPYLWVEPGFATQNSPMVLLPLDELRKQVKSMGINFQVTNGGHSPAVEVINTKVELILEAPETAIRKVTSFHPIYLWPDQTNITPTSAFSLQSPPDVPLTDTMISDLKSDRKRIYLLARIRYRDVFKPRAKEPYETAVCFSVNPAGLPFSPCPNGLQSWIK
jgi:hypothetical protein